LYCKKTNQFCMKNFKFLFGTILLIVVCVFKSSYLNAQRVMGVYLNGSDFLSSKPSFTNSENEKCKIKINDFNYKDYVDVKCKDIKYKFKKDSLFGYCDRAGNDFRFYNKTIYPVLNRGEQILIYKKEIQVGTPKSPELKIKYFFSKDAYSPIFNLTTNNIESAFEKNIIFKEFLETHFKNDTELAEFDEIHNIYKINRLLELSLKHNSN